MQESMPRSARDAFVSKKKKKKDNKNNQKIKKHLDNIARGMREINSVIMEAHHSISKLGCLNDIN